MTAETIDTIDVLMALFEGQDQVGDFEELPGEIVFWYDVTCPNELTFAIRPAFQRPHRSRAATSST